ncbi:Uncharacterised protein [uncultured archaeon]|nr:Uncharacterised protein [uncultured archaeon]
MPGAIVIGKEVLIAYVPTFTLTLPELGIVIPTLPVFLTLRVTGAWLVVGLRFIGLVPVTNMPALSLHAGRVTFEVAAAALETGFPHTLAPALAVKVTEAGTEPA